jgi:flavin reductase (DIM6/NTAB) family NADH-FMN oxidoreductase RutF
VVSGDELRAVMRRYPAGVSVVGVDTDGQRLAVTMGSLVSLSLEPPLVGIAVGKQNALHELLREAGEFGVSLLSSDQLELASRFARGLPPIALWGGVAVRVGEGPPLLEGALGWLRCTVAADADAGDHTFFVGAVESAELGAGGEPLVYLDSAFRAL